MIDKSANCTPRKKTLNLINFTYINKKFLPDNIQKNQESATIGSMSLITMLTPSWVFSYFLQIIKNRKLFKYFEKLEMNMGKLFFYY